jgi:2-polyprenyl-3-methyl-5-hydroxy-6-metoxy-1,4-benzoquinol methylase
LIKTIEDSLQQLKKEISSNPTVNVKVNGGACRIRVGNQELVTERVVSPPSIFQLIDGPDWPEAIDGFSLCSHENDEDKMIRAEGIIDSIIETNLKDARFLDFGCGEGHIARCVLDRGAALSVGYDIKPISLTSASPRLRFVNYIAELEPKGFDVILMYDVLDHCDDPVSVLMLVGQLLAPGGTVYASCHPWTSKHGGHYYRQYNKAYAHLVLDEAESHARGIRPEHVMKWLNPLSSYRQWFTLSGFSIKNEEIISEPLDRFFVENTFAYDALMKKFFGVCSPQEARQALEIEFVEYTLKLDSVH